MKNQTNKQKEKKIYKKENIILISKTTQSTNFLQMRTTQNLQKLYEYTTNICIVCTDIACVKCNTNYADDTLMH